MERASLAPVFVLCLLLAMPLALLAADDDGDGIENELDSCRTRANAPPLDCDTDLDGYGNFCAGDFDQNGLSGSSDFGLFTMNFGSSGSPGWKVEDMDCNGFVGGADFGVLTMNMSMAPGPSGLACAGHVPCPPDPPAPPAPEVVGR